MSGAEAASNRIAPATSRPGQPDLLRTIVIDVQLHELTIALGTGRPYVHLHHLPQLATVGFRPLDACFESADELTGYSPAMLRLS